MPLRIRRGTDAERLTITPAEGELIYTTDQKRVYVGDGTTLGGVQLTADAIVNNLESDLDLNSFDIIGVGNINIDGNLTVTGNLDGTLIGSINGNVTGNVTGDVLGNLTGNVTGDVTGSLFGNAFGNLTGDVVGSVFGNDSSLLVDGVNGKIVGPIEASILDIKIFGGLPGQLLSTDGSGNLSFEDNNVGFGLPNTIAYYDALGQTITGIPSVQWDSLNTSLSVTGNLTTQTFNTGNIDPIFQFLNIGGDPTNPLRNVIFDFGLFDSTPIEIKNIAAGIDDFSVGKFLFTSYGTTTDDTACTQLVPGQYLSSIVQSIKNPISNGGQDIITSAIIQSLDPAGSVTSTYASGKLIFANRFGPSNSPPDLAYLTFDSRGYLGVNKYNATEALDVDGNGLFSGTVTAAAFKGSFVADDSSIIVDGVSGAVTAPTVTASTFVQFGAITTSQRSALSPANGMVIYNSTDNRFQGYQNGSWINLDDGTSA